MHINLKRYWAKQTLKMYGLETKVPIDEMPEKELDAMMAAIAETVDEALESEEDEE